MTLLKSLLVLLSISFFTQVQAENSLGYHAEEEAKIIVLVNTANWCPACRANGERLEQEILFQFMDDPQYIILVNDLSDDKSIAQSLPAINQNGLSEFVRKNKATGTIFFIDAASKRMHSKISVTKDSEAIKRAFREALAAS